MTSLQSNRYIASLCKVTGEAAPLHAIAKRVDQFRKPRQTIEDIAKALGVSAVVKEKLPFDGGLFSKGVDLIIKINAASIPARQRFTLAHEVAHLIISSGSARSARRCLKSDPLEQACDAVAAELLMPIDEALRFVEEGASVDALRAFSNRFNVSLDASAVRIKELNAWRESIGLWKWNGRAEQLWYVGRRFWSDQQLPSGPFEEAMRNTSVVKTYALHDDMRGVRPVDVRVQRLGRDHVLGLIGP